MQRKTTKLAPFFPSSGRILPPVPPPAAALLLAPGLALPLSLSIVHARRPGPAARRAGRRRRLSWGQYGLFPLYLS